MASRFYLPNSGSPDISPAPDAAWEDVTILARRPSSTTKAGTAIATVSFTDSNTTNRDILFRQYVVTEPLAAQTISAQTLEFQMRGSQVTTARNMFLTLGVRVVSSDGSSVIGTILPVTRDNTEFTSDLTNRRLTATTTEVTVSDGDRLVFEIGTGGTPSSSDHDSSLSFGDDNATDLPENDTATTANNPWIEFPNTLSFYTESAGRVQRLTTLGVG